MTKGLTKVSNFFRIPINLIRLEIFFAALFCLFFSVFVEELTDLIIDFTIGIYFTVSFIIVGFISFLTIFTNKSVRILSYLVYISGFSLILYVVYINNFSVEASYLLIINYGLYCLSLSNVTIYLSLNSILWLLTFLIIFLLDFETEVSLWFVLLSYVVLGLAGLAVSYSRSSVKKRNNERNEYLSIVFNNSSNALILLRGESLKFIYANQHAFDILNFSSNDVDNFFDINELQVDGVFIFRNIGKEEKKTIELKNQRLIIIETKKVLQGNKTYYLIEIKTFKNRIELSETFEFDKLKTINDQSYETLFKENPALISIVNRDGKIIDINDTYLDFLGYLKSEIVGRSHSILDYRDYKKQRKLIREKAWQGETQLFEKEIVSKNGTILFIEVIIRKAKYFGEEVLISNGRDISQRKMLEKIAEYNQLQYSTLFKYSPIGLFISDLDGDIVEVNKSFQKLLDYNREDFLGRNISCFTSSELTEVESQLWNKLLNGTKSFIELEQVYKRKDGKEIHTLLKVSVQKDEDNLPSKLLGQVINISNFVEAENSIQASLKSYKDAFNTSFELRYILNNQNEFIDVSNSFEKEYGYSREDIIGKTPDFLGKIEMMDFPKMQESIKLARAGIDQDVLWWSKRKDGSVFPKRLHIRKGIYFGQEVLMCSGQNIQEYYDYEQEILKSEQKYKNLINKTIFGVIIFTKGKIVFANERALDILKYKSIYDINGFDQSKIIKTSQLDWQQDRERSVMSGEDVPLLEFELIDSNGDSVVVESIPTKIDFDGEECILESFVEITDRKKVEEVKKQVLEHKVDNDSLRIQLEQNRVIQRRLQNSQSYSEGIIESSLDMIFTTNTKSQINKINSAAKNHFQYQQKEIIKKSFGMLFSNPKFEEEIIENLNLYNSYSGDVVMKRKDGSTFPALLSVSQLFNTEGTFLGIMGISRDITELVSKELEIKKQASKLNSVIESSSHYFFTLNRNYRFTSFNKLFKDDVKKNYNVELELFDDFFDLVKIAQDRNVLSVEYWKNIFGKAFNGESVEFEIERNSIKGETYYREIYIHPIEDENGVIEEISGIGHDVTQKKLYEIELKKSLNEKEILLKEVHHRVKNNMQVISSILSLQSSYVTDKYVLDVLMESRNRIAAMASIHERLYRTTNLSDIRFSSYVQDLVESLVNTYELSEISVEVVFSLDEVFLSLNHAIPCGLILNELISNSLKYAFKGRKAGKIEVVLISKSEKISLSLADDGVGIPKDISVENTDTLGLQLVSTLVEQMEGKLLLERNNGTKFIISFDTKQEV